MSYPVKNGQTSVVLRFKLLDSSSTTGAGLTGLTNASSGLIISTIADNESTATAYTQAGSTIQTITTLGTYAAPSASNCRFKEVDSTNHKGLYEIQLADARFAVSSAKSLIISVSGATNLAQADFVVPLVVDDPYTAKLTDKTGYSLSQAFPSNFSSLAITAGGAVTVGTNNDKTGYSLSQTFPTNFSSLSIDGSGRVDVIKINGTSQTARDIGASVLLSSGTGAGQISLSSGTVTVGTNNDKTGYTASTVTDKTGYSLTQSFPTNFASMAITSGGAVTAGTVSDKTGYSLSSGGLSSVTTWTVAITGDITGNLSGSVGSVTGLTASNLDVAVSTRLSSSGYTAPLDAAGTRSAVGLSSANLDTQLSTIAGYIDTEVAAIKAKTDNLPSDPADASDIAASFSGIVSAISALPTSVTVDAIKAKTDSLSFTVSGQVDANIQYVNDTQVSGDGSGTPWGP